MSWCLYNYQVLFIVLELLAQLPPTHVLFITLMMFIDSSSLFHPSLYLTYLYKSKHSSFNVTWWGSPVILSWVFFLSKKKKERERNNSDAWHHASIDHTDGQYTTNFRNLTLSGSSGCLKHQFVLHVATCTVYLASCRSTYMHWIIVDRTIYFICSIHLPLVPSL